MTLRQRELGPDEGTAHVLLHGMPGGAACWEPLLRFAEGRRVVVLEIPHDRPTNAIAIEHAAIEQIRAIDAERIRYCGVSYGGYLGARMAPQLGPRLERMVLVGALPMLSREAAALRRELVRQLESGALPADRSRQMMLPMFLGEDGMADAGAVSLVDRVLMQLDAEAWSRFAALGLELADSALAVNRYETDAIVLHAERDHTLPLSAGRALAELGSRADLVTVDSDAHLLEVVRPDLVADALFADGHR